MNDVLLAVGRLQEGVENLRDDFREEKVSATTSRAQIHKRLDDQARDVAALQTSVAIAAQIDAQVRDEVKALAVEVAANQAAVTPSVEEWKRIKVLGVGFSGLLAIGGLSIGSMLVLAGDAFWTWLRHMLKIS